MKTLLYIPLWLGLIALFAAADWPGFRGGSQGGVAENANPPMKWGEAEGVAWKKDLPGRGAASVIVVDGKVFVTASSKGDQDRLFALCYDTTSGKQLWKREFWATGRTSTHPSSSVAAPTPASDGEHLIAFYSSNDLYCFNLAGDLQWFRGLTHDYPKAGNDVGMASSPTIVDGVVVVQVENQGDSFAAGIDTNTGETLWRIKRPRLANWSSPTVIPAAGDRQAVVLLTSRKGIAIVDPKSGDILWNYDTDVSGTPSAAVDGSRFYVASNGLTCFELPKNSFAAELLWDNGKIRPTAASPIIAGDKIYVVDRGGILTCGSTAGESLWKLRLKGTFWATPVLAGKHLFCLNYDGDAQIVDVSGDKGELVATNPVGETLQGSPAAADNALYFRSDEHLWKVSKE